MIRHAIGLALIIIGSLITLGAIAESIVVETVTGGPPSPWALALIAGGHIYIVGGAFLYVGSDNES